MTAKFEYPVLSCDIYDGDTIKATIDRGFGDSKKLSIRIKGIDTPEIRHTNPLHKEAGFAVRAVGDLWLHEVQKGGRILMFRSTDRDKYSGRGVGNFYADDCDFGAFMIRHGFAKFYGGGTKNKWTDAELLIVRDRAKMYVREGGKKVELAR